MSNTQIVEELKYLLSLQIHDYPQALRYHTRAAHIAMVLYGNDSAVIRSLVAVFDRYEDYAQQMPEYVQQWRDAILGFLEDFLLAVEKGWVGDVQFRAQGEVLSDLVGLARTHLDEGQKDVAAVLAAAALEEFFKRCASKYKIHFTPGEKLANIAGALNREGILIGAEKGMVDSMLGFRNRALHAEWNAVTPASVSSAIGFLDQLLLKHFA